MNLHKDALKWVLLPPGDPFISQLIGGQEVEVPFSNSDCFKLFETEGSSRYVFEKDGEPVSGLQILKLEKDTGIIANVYTKPEHRGNRYAGLLITKALNHFAEIIHSASLTDDGRRWANKHRVLKGYGVNRNG